MRSHIAPVVVAAMTALLSGLAACGGGGASGGISAAGDDSALLSLTVSSGTLAPAFAPTTFVYTVGPAILPDTVTVTPTAAHEEATIRVDGVLVTSGHASLPIPLGMGLRVVIVAVTGHSGDTKVYGVAFDRTSAELSTLRASSGTLAPVFNPATLAYSVGPALLPETVTLTPTATDARSEIRVDGVLVSSGSVIPPIALAMGPRTVTVVVTAVEGTVQAYTVTFDRTSAELSDLVPSTGTFSPVFEPGTLSYTVGPQYFPRTTTLTPTALDPGATITVNDVVTPTGEPSAYISFLPLPEPVTVAVTARDGVTKAYYIVVFEMRRFAYVVNGNSHDVTTFAIDGATGALSEVGTEVAAEANPVSIAVDPSGRFAYVANFSSHNVTTFAINATSGTLTEVESEVAAGTNPLSITVDPSGRFAYVSNYGSNNVTTFAIDGTTGALSEVGTEVAAGFGAHGITVDPSGRFAYVANFYSDNVTAFAIDASTGALTEVGSAVAAGPSPICITVDPSGRFAYVANLNADNVTTFAIDGTTGVLSEVGTAVAAGTNPRPIAILP